MNGIADHGEHPISPKAYIGKRKRTPSPELKTDSIPKAQSTSIQDELENALQSMQKHDPMGRILKYTLPSRPDEPSLKRQRTNSSNAPANNIEARILTGVYKSVDELLVDVIYIENDFNKDSQVNGHMVQIDAIRELLFAMNKTSKSSDPSKSTQVNGTPAVENEVERPAAQVLSLRSQTETGIKQLFSGLPHSANGPVSEIDGRKLPHGFELTSITMMDRSKRLNKDNRTFGDIFAAHRNTKPLEAPRPDRRHRDVSTLGFIQPYTSLTPVTKHDHLPNGPDPGTWLEYSADGSQPLTNGKKTKIRRDTPISLFRAAFSSFAPTTDHSKSVNTDADHSRRWWRKFAAANTYLDLPEHDMANGQSDEITQFQPDEKFEEMLENFVSESDLDDLDESEKLLNEVSELLETLRSHQIIREMEVARGPSSANKPTKSEIDIYDMLRSQLQILISNLPPYAVAKLNGDQLEALSISTNLLVVPPEFSGTSHADEFTLRRAKAVQVATTSVARPNPVGPTRNSYGTPASTYNTQAYNRNAPATAYTGRQGPVPYNAPRTAAPQTTPYAQPNYRAASAAYPNSTIQQFQRAVANGLAQVGSPTPYIQRPPQTGSQPMYAGGDSTPSALVNGQVTQTQQSRQHDQVAHGIPTSTSQADLNQKMTDSVKLLQQQTALTGRASNTPQPSSNTGALQQAATAGATS